MKKQRYHLAAFLVGLVVAIIGTALLRQSFAATYTTSAEAESGNASGNIQPIGDSAASGSHAERFGGETIFGDLVTNPAHNSAEMAAGVTMAMIEVGWDSYEPTENSWNTSYINSLKSQITTYRNSGRQITLATGLHYTPSWVFNVADSHYVNAAGQRPGEDQINLVFNQAVRAKAETYLKKLASDLGINNFSAIRITSGGSAELLYPNADAYWAFDKNAQNGPNLPGSMDRNPFPGWTPGSRSYNGQPFSTAQVQTWLDWYVKSLDNVAAWQMDTMISTGYSGGFQLLTPGDGSRPSTYQADINNYLPAPSITAVGAVWHKIYVLSPYKDRLTAYVSSVADHSGTNDDGCTSGDNKVAITDTAANSWSATRWVSRLAAANNITSVGGENPGYDAPPSFNTWYRDASDSGMMATALRQAKSCNFSVFYWAHDDKLWDGTLPFSNYASRIANY